MKKRNCYLFVFDGYSDPEPALAIATLQKFSDCMVYTFSLDGKPVRSMANMHVQPDRAMADVDITKTDLLILPGGEAWENGGNLEVMPLVKKVLDNDKTVAAICGATIGLATQGYLDNIRHTSNSFEYLNTFAPNYKGAKHYEVKPAVADGNIITANGAGIIDFMVTIFKKDQYMDEATLEGVDKLYKSGGLDNPFGEKQKGA
jgi:putative intracellular protease/amidase